MIFLLGNYDSFTYNLYQYFGELGEDIIVKRQDACTLTDIEDMHPDLIVISPGPCTPSESPLSLAVIRHFMGKIPLPLLLFYLIRISKYFVVHRSGLFEFNQMGESKPGQLRELAPVGIRRQKTSYKLLNFKTVRKIVPN